MKTGRIMDIIIEKKDFDESKIITLMDKASKIMLGRQDTDTVRKLYSIIMVNVFMRKKSNYDGMNEVCDNAMFEIKDNKSIMNYMNFVLSLFILNEQDFFCINLHRHRRRSVSERQLLMSR